MEGIERRIIIPPAVSQQIREQLNMSESGVRNALAYRRSGELSEQVRALALQQGGLVCLTIPECEAVHHANGRLRQTFSNGVEVIYDKSINLARILCGKLVLEEKSAPSVIEYLDMLQRAKNYPIA